MAVAQCHRTQSSGVQVPWFADFGRMRALLLSLLALLGCVVPARAKHDVELVVSLCRETQLHFVQTVAEEVLRGLSVKTTYYCKCGPQLPGCLELENVGREAHTFLHHMVTRYDSLGAH